MVQLLLAEGASTSAVNKRGHTPLHLASLACHADVARMMLEAGGSPTTVDNDGRTPLIYATLSHSGSSHLVRILLEAGALVTEMTKGGNTPLHIASLRGHIDVVRELVTAGASAAVVDKRGHTPLHKVATHEGDLTDLAKLLLGAGASVTARSSVGLLRAHWHPPTCPLTAAFAAVGRGNTAACSSEQWTR